MATFTNPDAVGMDPEKLEKVKQLFHAQIQQGLHPGAGLAVYRYGHLVLDIHGGVSDVHTNTRPHGHLHLDPRADRYVHVHACPNGDRGSDGSRGTLVHSCSSGKGTGSPGFTVGAWPFRRESRFFALFARFCAPRDPAGQAFSLLRK